MMQYLIPMSNLFPIQNYGEYYHKKISITKNHFVNNDSCLVYADNIEHVIFKDNLLENQISDSLVEFVNCGSIECDIN